MQIAGMFLGLAFIGVLSAAVAVIPDYPGYKQQIASKESMKTIKIDPFFAHKYPTIPVTECMLVTSESGSFSYTSKTESDEVCGIYFLTDPDRRVELQFLTLDVSCGNRDLVSVVDGWELNGELFPSEEDYDYRPSSKSRVTEFCGRRVPGVFLSSQNAALIQYRVAEQGTGFTVLARYPKLFAPCNVLAVSTNEPFTLRNYGRRINCTYTALYPSLVRVHALRVGLTDLFGDEPGTLRNCEKMSPWDQVEIGGSHGLDTSKIQLVDSICGTDLKSDYRALIEYGVTSVRLISSGFFENFVTVTLKPF